MRFSSRLIPQTSEGRRQLAVAGVLLAFAFVVMVVTSIVLAAIGEVARHANILDDGRSRETTNGALKTFRFQLKATLTDYAAWDDATRYVYAPDGAEWIVSNFGDMTLDSDLFDTAVIIDSQRNVQMAYHDGKPMQIPVNDYFGPAIWTLLDEARKPDTGSDPDATGFVRTQDGIAAVGISLIRKKSGEILVKEDEYRYLIFARHLNNKVAQLSRVYVIDGLHLAPPEAESAFSVPIVDPDGRTLAKMLWTSRGPGDASFAQVRPMVLVAVGIVGCFFLALLLIGVVAMRRLKEDETRASQLAMQDRLSGLLNRAGLYAGLEQLVEKARRDKSDVLLLYLDLDGFKEVNDAYGHGIGDQLIRGVAAGLKMLIPQGAMLARLGGDEFAVALATRRIDRVAESLAQNILEFFSEPFVIGERVAIVGASIGASSSPMGLIASEEALRRADLAMYKAKENGRGRFVRYDPDMDIDREERNDMEVDLRRAIELEALYVVYQPVIAAGGRRTIGVEALVRWDRPGHGSVSPDRFIPIAETTGLIDSLGLFVLRKACLQVLNWPGINIAVNVSPGQFRNPAFTSNVQRVIRETGIDPSRIVLEVTEGYFIQNPARARWTIAKLKQLGVKIALDDFGSGFSSVGYLRQFGFDRMKIDRSLVAALGESPRAGELLQATVSIARALGIPVTAEGIEKEEQAIALELCGCDELQGFYFGRPTSPEQILARLENEGGNDDRTAAA